MTDQTTIVQQLVDLFEAVGKGWEAGAENDYIQQGGLSYLRFYKYDSTDRVRFLFDYYGKFLSSIEPLAGSVGCDLGSWLGFSTAIQAAHGCRLVYGVDIRPEQVREAEAWRCRQGVENLRFRPLRDGVIPLASDSIDWVIINNVLCNAPPGSFPLSLGEAHRILKPGGTLIFCDGNNPHCPQTAERLKQEFFAAEMGEGSLDAPDGLNHNARRQMIDQAVADLSDENLDRLARETCYLWGDEVLRAARRFAGTGEWPGSVFDPDSLRTPLLPHDGAANGNVTDPFELCARMKAIGFGRCDITDVTERRRLDNEEIWNILTAKMSFCIFADKQS